MTLGMRGSLHAFALLGVILMGYGEVKGQVPTDPRSYPSTGFPPWTPSAGLPPLPVKRKPDIDRLLLDASAALQGDGRDREATTILKMVLAAKHEPAIKSYYPRNSQHTACLQLSNIYERHGDLTKALEFAVLARDKHPFSEMCGVMVGFVHTKVEERIASLSERMREDVTRPSPRRTDSRTTTANPSSLPSLRR